MITKRKSLKRSGSLLFDVLLYIIAAAVVMGGIYLGISFLKGEADVNSLTSNDSKVLMDTAISYRTNYYKSGGKYIDFNAENAKAWSPLELDNTTPGIGSFFKSSKFDHECHYQLGAYDLTPTTSDNRWAVFIDCSTAATNQNWSTKKIEQVELSFANAFKARIDGALIGGQMTTAPVNGTKFDLASMSETNPDSDGKILIYNLVE